MNSLTVFAITAISTAVIHTLIPDHWLPFVVMGRIHQWSTRRTLWITGFSAVLHVSVSILLGILIFLIGDQSVHQLGEAFEIVVGILLFCFGLFYTIRAIRHIGIGHTHLHLTDGLPIKRTHDETDPLLAPNSRSEYTLAFILGLNPCVPILTIFFATIDAGFSAFITVAFSFSIFASLTLLAITLIALHGSRQVNLFFMERYGDVITGGVITLLGGIIIIMA